MFAIPGVQKKMQHRVLCRTIAGNACDLLTITSYNGNTAAIATRPAVILTARVHPGETQSSWMLLGLLEFLLSDHEDAEIMRESFLFKIVPMLNPDGVVVAELLIYNPDSFNAYI